MKRAAAIAPTPLLAAAALLWAASAQAEPPPQPTELAAPPPTATVAPAASAPLPEYMQQLAHGEEALQRGDYLEAAYALARSRQAARRAQAVPEATILRIERLRAEARSHIAALSIGSDPGSTIEVDGTSFETVPLAGEVLVMPGKHRIIARGPLCLGTKDIDARAGRVENVEVSCSVAPAWRKPLLVPSAVVGALAVGAGFLALGVSEHKRVGLEQLVADANAGGFVGPGTLARVRSLDHERVDWLNASITGFLIGGGGIAAACALGFGVEPRRPAEPPKLWGATVGPGGAGLWMRW